jgi:hypothetical protein
MAKLDLFASSVTLTVSQAFLLLFLHANIESFVKVNEAVHAKSIRNLYFEEVRPVNISIEQKAYTLCWPVKG